MPAERIVLDAREYISETRPDRTAKQMTKIAGAICARGQRVEAEDVLRKAIALAPQFAAPRLALACLLGEAPAKDAQNVANLATLVNFTTDASLYSPHSPDNVLSFGVTCAIQI